MRPNDLNRGALYMLAAGLAFACSGALVKLAAPRLSNEMIVFFRNALGLAALVPLVWLRGWSILKTQHLRLHILRALVGLGAMYCYFYSIARLPLAVATLFTYSTPLFAPIIAFLWLGERFTPVFRWIISLGFAGILLILKPGYAVFTPVSLIALASGLFAATAAVAIRRMTRSEPATRIVFYFGLISTLVSAVPLSWGWKTPDARAWALLLAIGVFSSVAQLLLTRAYANAQAAHVGPFTYSTVVFAALVAWIFWNEIPDAYSLLGIVTVSVAGVSAMLRGGGGDASAVPLTER